MKSTERIRIYDMIYDSKDRGDNGKGKFLGEYQVLQQIFEDIYSEEFIGKDRLGNLFLVRGDEVCGVGGGVRYTSTQLELPPENQAHWEICSDGYYPYCSHCRKEPQGREMTDFCPNCGYSMK